MDWIRFAPFCVCISSKEEVIARFLADRFSLNLPSFFLSSLLSLSLSLSISPPFPSSSCGWWSQTRQHGGDVAQLVEHRASTPPTQVRFPGAARDFLSRVNFQCRLSHDAHAPCVQSQALTSVRTLKIPWSMSGFGRLRNTKTPSRHLDWVARLYRSWLSPGKATRISNGRNPIGTIQ